MKRIFDLVATFFGFLILFPVIILTALMVVSKLGLPVFFKQFRPGLNGKLFSMYKFRTMSNEYDIEGKLLSDELRLTKFGKFLRSSSLDEIPELWNVIKGDMSLVGPRPNVKPETDLYTNIEKGLLLVRPGITDFSSIVFSDEGDILEGSVDPDLTYNQIIRPWKSRLAIFYTKNSNMIIDIKIIS